MHGGHPRLELQGAPERVLGDHRVGVEVRDAERVELRRCELRVAHLIASSASLNPAATCRNTGSNSSNRSWVRVPTIA